MLYPALVHKEEGSAWGVTLPDFPGCHVAGDTLDEAVANVQEAVELYLEGEDLPMPKPSSLEELQPVDRLPASPWILVHVAPPSRIPVS